MMIVSAASYFVHLSFWLLSASQNVLCSDPSSFHPVVAGDTFIRTIGYHLQDHTASQP